MSYNHYLTELDDDDEEPLEIVLHSAEVGPRCGDFCPLRVLTSRGRVEGRLYSITRPRCAALLLGGSAGGWSSPADSLYSRLGRELRRHSVAALHMRYRQPECLEECVLDALAGLGYLESEGLGSIAFVGHGMGAIVALQAAALSASARSVVTLALDGAGPDPDELPRDCALLMIHGLGDAVAPVEASEGLYEAAPQRAKQIILYPDAGHGLDEVATEVYDLVLDWLSDQLRGCSF